MFSHLSLSSTYKPHANHTVMPNRQILRKEGAMDSGRRDGWRYEEERETPSVSVCSKSGQAGVSEIIKRTQSHSTAVRHITNTTQITHAPTCH